MESSLEGLTVARVQRYLTRGPRYTSYPTVPVWGSGDFRDRWEDAQHRLRGPAGTAPRPVSIYVHLPFCRRLCTFCGCNRTITHQRPLMLRYLDALEREIDATAARTGPLEIHQLHFGGGTPTWYRPDELARVVAAVGRLGRFAPHAERSVEVHPTVTTEEHIATLTGLGFQRFSLGVQDTNPEVQVAINREQTVAQTTATMEAARRLGADSLNLDLVYGLPKQTPETWQQTLQQVLQWRPDRLAVYSFAYIPGMFKAHARAIKPSDLPPPEMKIRLLLDALQTLTAAGYVYIGMDHFALPTDELTVAHDNGSLHRNFMGYTTQRGLPQLGFGVSAISDLRVPGYAAYAQNAKDLPLYLAGAEGDGVPAIRWHELDDDDRDRRELIETLLCLGRLPADAVEHYPRARAAVEAHVADGLLEPTTDGWRATPVGRLFLRNLALPFDRYFDPAGNVSFSATV